MPAMIATLAMCMLTTGLTIATSPNLKGDPELDRSYKETNIVKKPNDLGTENEIHGHDLEPDPFDELDQCNGMRRDITFKFHHVTLMTL